MTSHVLSSKEISHYQKENYPLNQDISSLISPTQNLSIFDATDTTTIQASKVHATASSIHGAKNLSQIQGDVPSNILQAVPSNPQPSYPIPLPEKRHQKINPDLRCQQIVNSIKICKNWDKTIENVLKSCILINQSKLKEKTAFISKIVTALLERAQHETPLSYDQLACLLVLVFSTLERSDASYHIPRILLPHLSLLFCKAQSIDTQWLNNPSVIQAIQTNVWGLDCLNSVQKMKSEILKPEKNATTTPNHNLRSPLNKLNVSVFSYSSNPKTTLAIPEDQNAFSLTGGFKQKEIGLLVIFSLFIQFTESEQNTFFFNYIDQLYALQWRNNAPIHRILSLLDQSSYLFACLYANSQLKTHAEISTFLSPVKDPQSLHMQESYVNTVHSALSQYKQRLISCYVGKLYSHPFAEFFLLEYIKELHPNISGTTWKELAPQINTKNLLADVKAFILTYKQAFTSKALAHIIPELCGNPLLNAQLAQELIYTLLDAFASEDALMHIETLEVALKKCILLHQGGQDLFSQITSSTKAAFKEIMNLTWHWHPLSVTAPSKDLFAYTFTQKMHECAQTFADFASCLQLRGQHCYSKVIDHAHQWLLKVPQWISKENKKPMPLHLKQQKLRVHSDLSDAYRSLYPIPILLARYLIHPQTDPNNCLLLWNNSFLLNALFSDNLLPPTHVNNLIAGLQNAPGLTLNIFETLCKGLQPGFLWEKVDWPTVATEKHFSQKRLIDLMINLSTLPKLSIHVFATFCDLLASEKMVETDSSIDWTDQRFCTALYQLTTRGFYLIPFVFRTFPYRSKMLKGSLDHPYIPFFGTILQRVQRLENLCKLPDRPFINLLRITMDSLIQELDNNEFGAPVLTKSFINQYLQE